MTLKYHKQRVVSVRDLSGEEIKSMTALTFTFHIHFLLTSLVEKNKRHIWFTADDS